MSKHNKITLVCSIVTLVLVLLFSFQNCSTNQNPGNLIVNQSSIASCETAIFNSSTTGETIFSVGQIINFSLDSSPQSLGGQFLITDVNDSVIQNSNITTPTFTQQIFKNASDIGDYTYFMQLNDSSGKAICSTAKRTFTITNGQSSNPTCVFSIPSGNGQSFKVNDAIVLDVQSVPSGLQAYISGKNLSPTGAVNSTLSRVSIGATEAKQNNVAANADVGQWKRFAEVVANDGSFVRCSPLQDTTITIAALPGVTPTPPPAPTPSPTPTTSPPPNSGSGNISSNRSTCQNNCNGNCFATLTWISSGTPNAQVFHSADNGVTWTVAVSDSGVAMCGKSGTAEINFYSGTHIFKLFPVSTCVTGTGAVTLPNIAPYSTAVVTFSYGKPPGGICL